MTTGVQNRLSFEDLEQIALQFRVLGEPTRLKILEAVCDRPRAVNDIVAAVSGTQANVSKHLSLMAAAGVLSREKRGQSVYYGIRSPLIPKVCALMHAELTSQRPRGWSRVGSRPTKR
jgi:ArsR family transcriptional regulator